MVNKDANLHRPRGSLAAGRWSVDLDPAAAGWTWTALKVLTLGPGETKVLDTGPCEMLVLPLAGSCTVSCGGQRLELAGRPSVFDGLSDFVYLPRAARAAISSAAGGRFALPGAVADRDLPVRYGPAGDVAVELRGAGSCSRQVNNFCTQDAFEADRLLACEVITPAGNWSSYPPHKHDENRPGESVLEEIYYFEFRGAGPGGRPPGTPRGEAAIGYQRVYGTADRPVDVLAEVRSGDVVLIPHGWHGPSMAVPGYDMYYLNVMAGPGERRWLICDDPDHAWIRQTWECQPPDPRLPLYASGGSR
ncbi:MAG TPA: 5-deoxy-glucuronate isomerase [Streptosporangiaceae bacterium]|nr:5-deoxy-glucuronate isomerase [Streptosporangiaceae bacterium]